ncbi:MAG: GCN5-like N-acetyltransferase [Thermoleophilia bacterium]|nr:GCN5-like N-acetyltransferase [Thermoleophilia bacterium]
MSSTPSANVKLTHPLAPIWPPARLRVVTPRVELRLPTDGEIVALTDLAAGGVHAPEEMPFASPWTQREPDEVARRALQWHAQCRASWSPERWTLLLAVFVDGEVAGAQDLAARSFATLGEVSSGSWLGRGFHGRGLGTEMRAALLHLAFAGLGARSATSGAYDDNRASQRVSEKCGYAADGINVVERARGPLAPGGASTERAIELRYRITRAAWAERRRADVELVGLDADVLAAFGAAAHGSSTA